MNEAVEILREMARYGESGKVAEPWMVDRAKEAIAAIEQFGDRERIAYFVADGAEGYWQTSREGKPYNFRVDSKVQHDAARYRWLRCEIRQDENGDWGLPSAAAGETDLNAAVDALMNEARHTY